MKSALILHGKPSRERYENPNIEKPHKANWLPWLASELGKRGIVSAVPAFPEPYAPDYGKWKEVFEQYEVDSQTSLIGHSAGGEFALRWLSENHRATIDQLALIAPWRDEQGKYGEFSDYELDTSLERRVGRIIIFNSLDDTAVIQSTSARLRNTFPSAYYREFERHGHFMFGNNMKRIDLPELRDVLTSPGQL